MLAILDNITYYKCDVSKWEEVEAASKEIKAEVSRANGLQVKADVSWSMQLGHPTVLINNAGVVQGKRILDLTSEDIKQ